MYIHKLLNSLKYVFSMLVTIIFLYPLMALIGTFLKTPTPIFDHPILSRIADILIHPPIIFPYTLSSVTLDLLPILIIFLAGLWGWFHYPGKPRNTVMRD